MKPRDDSDYLPLYKIEELFSGSKQMLNQLVTVLLENNMPIYAKGVYLRNKYYFSDDKLKQQMDDIEYDES